MLASDRLLQILLLPDLGTDGLRSGVSRTLWAVPPRSCSAQRNNPFGAVQAEEICALGTPSGLVGRPLVLGVSCFSHRELLLWPSLSLPVVNKALPHTHECTAPTLVKLLLRPTLLLRSALLLRLTVLLCSTLLLLFTTPARVLVQIFELRSLSCRHL